MEAQPRKRGRSEAAAAGQWQPGDPNPANGQPTFRPPAALGDPLTAEFKAGEVVDKLDGKAAPRLQKGAWDAIVSLMGDGAGRDGGHAAVPRTTWCYSDRGGIETDAPGVVVQAEAGAEPAAAVADAAGVEQPQAAGSPAVIPRLYLAVSLDGRALAPVDGNALHDGEKRRQRVWVRQLREALAAVLPDVPTALSRLTLHATSVYLPAPGQVLLVLDVSTWVKSSKEEEVVDVEDAAEAAAPSQKKQKLTGASPLKGQRRSSAAAQGKGAQGDAEKAAGKQQAKRMPAGPQVALPIPRPPLHKKLAAFELPPLKQQLQRKGQELRRKDHQYGVPSGMLEPLSGMGVQQTPPRPGSKLNSPYTYTAEGSGRWAFSEDGTAVVLQDRQQQQQKSPEQPAAGAGPTAAAGAPPAAGSATKLAPLLLVAVGVNGGRPVPTDAIISLYPKNPKLVLRRLRENLGEANLPDPNSLLHAYTLYRTRPHGHALLVADFCRGTLQEREAAAGGGGDGTPVVSLVISGEDEVESVGSDAEAESEPAGADAADAAEGEVESEEESEEAGGMGAAGCAAPASRRASNSNVARGPGTPMVHPQEQVAPERSAKAHEDVAPVRLPIPMQARADKPAAVPQRQPPQQQQEQLPGLQPQRAPPPLAQTQQQQHQPQPPPRKRPRQPQQLAETRPQAEPQPQPRCDPERPVLGRKPSGTQPSTSVASEAQGRKQRQGGGEARSQHPTAPEPQHVGSPPLSPLAARGGSSAAVPGPPTANQPAAHGAGSFVSAPKQEGSGEHGGTRPVLPVAGSSLGAEAPLIGSDEVASLRQRVKNLEGKLQLMSRKLGETASKQADAEVELEAARESQAAQAQQQVELVTELEQLREETCALRAQLEAAQQVEASAVKELADTRAELGRVDADLKAGLERERRVAATHQRQTKQLQDEVDGLKGALAAEKAARDRLEAELQYHVAELVAAKKMVDVAAAELAAVKKMVEERVEAAAAELAAGQAAAKRAANKAAGERAAAKEAADAAAAELAAVRKAAAEQAEAAAAELAATQAAAKRAANKAAAERAAAKEAADAAAAELAAVRKAAAEQAEAAAAELAATQAAAKRAANKAAAERAAAKEAADAAAAELAAVKKAAAEQAEAKLAANKQADAAAAKLEEIRKAVEELAAAKKTAEEQAEAAAAELAEATKAAKEQADAAAAKLAAAQAAAKRAANKAAAERAAAKEAADAAAAELAAVRKAAAEQAEAAAAELAATQAAAKRAANKAAAERAAAKEAADAAAAELAAVRKAAAEQAEAAAAELAAAQAAAKRAANKAAKELAAANKAAAEQAEAHAALKKMIDAFYAAARPAE
ncbi:hypothetical protein HXX76_009687 [Chlamydomonas incerta]|uniref:Uncharacterized protein n=1 Tax=Chlamydomonas incerta TaxID=51695 RepID=A0A835VVR7_CHLIN|nr:hypothetical protein HXX76_009687 [Chlamydomonas incerta]|eukprot:KAG2431157.1 hypothetical protein HXX76_009687 [Chlamydomonas incerta]